METNTDPFSQFTDEWRRFTVRSWFPEHIESDRKLAQSIDEAWQSSMASEGAVRRWCVRIEDWLVSKLSPEARLRALCTALLEAYRGADSQHNVQITSLRLLPADRQAELKGMERELVTTFSDAVIGIAPQLKGSKLLKPVTMSLFGMFNWHYLWFKNTGTVTRADYADLVTRLISDGTRNLLKQPSRAQPKTQPKAQPKAPSKTSKRAAAAG